MRNVSIKGENIRLVSGISYYVIDVLYLKDIQSNIDNLNLNILDKEIEEKVFPFTEAPFGRIIGNGNFEVKAIKSIKIEDLNPNARNCFVTDTGLIIFIAEGELLRVSELINYDNLIDMLMANVIDFNYWDDIASKFNENYLGLILAPGIGSGYQFEGSGLYKIEL